MLRCRFPCPAVPRGLQNHPGAGNVAELFNAFNHTNLNNPNSAMNNSNFGRILGAGSPRIVQFGLKYVF